MAVILLGGRPGQTPADAAAVGWWDFSDAGSVWADTGRTTPITDGTVIKGVTDKGSGANHLSEATNGPTWRTSPGVSFGGYPAADFDGTNDKLASASKIVPYGNGGRSGEMTWMAVMSHDTALAAEGGGWNAGNVLVYCNDAATAVGYYIAGSSFTPGYLSQWSTSGAAIIARKAASVSTKYIYTGIMVGNGAADPGWRGDCYAGVNDTRTASLVNANGTGNFGGVGTNPSTIQFGNANGGGWWNGQVCEIAYWNSNLAEATRQAVETYWAWKYGITLPY